MRGVCGCRVACVGDFVGVCTAYDLLDIILWLS